MVLKPDTMYVHFDENGRLAHVLFDAPKPEHFEEYRLVDQSAKQLPKAPGFVLRDKTCGLYVLTHLGPSGRISMVSDPDKARRFEYSSLAFRFIDFIHTTSGDPHKDLEVCFVGLDSHE